MITKFREFRVGDTVIFNDLAWFDTHQGVSEFSGRVGVLKASTRGTIGATWSVYYADDDFAYGIRIHETWLLPIFLIEELP